MRAAVVTRYIGVALLLNAAFMSIAAAVSLLRGDAAFSPLALSAVTTAIAGVFPLIFVPA